MHFKSKIFKEEMVNDYRREVTYQGKFTVMLY